MKKEHKTIFVSTHLKKTSVSVELFTQTRGCGGPPPRKYSNLVLDISTKNACTKALLKIQDEN